MFSIAFFSTAFGGMHNDYAVAVERAHQVKTQLVKFFDVLTADEKLLAYSEDTNDMRANWLMCPIVEQCLYPRYGLPLNRMNPQAYGYMFLALFYALGESNFNSLNLQQGVPRILE